MRPFFLTSGNQFRPPAPPDCDSPEFRAALAEIRHFSDTRTPEQLAIAQYWAGTTGSLVAGLWNEKVSGLITQHHLNERRAAHALALTNMAAMDANIACHDGKYAYWFIRPFQADPAITTPIGRPNHPSYPSNHACVSGTFAYVLGALLPGERDQLAAQADQAAESRLYAGIHYRFDKDAGLEIARRVTGVALLHDVHGAEPFSLSGAQSTR
jgi:membrane-associated phospholipid phosphatase